ncbi:MAG: hypothetical protein AAB966_02895 [Patescibacteria group bacterium]
MKPEEQFDFMHLISKLVIVIPIVAIIIALLLKQEFKQPALPQVQPTKQSVSVTPGTTVQIDLNKEYVCQNKEKTAYIKNKKLHLISQNKNGSTIQLLSGDCLYSWKKGSFSGEKTCGLSGYISTMETISRMGLMSTDAMIDTALEFTKQTGFMGSKVSIQTFLKTCKEEKVQNVKVFEVPKEVLFRNKKTP